MTTSLDCVTLTLERHARATDKPKYLHKPMLAEKTIEEFVAENDISLAYTKALSNPSMGGDMFHYNCTLTIGNRSLMIPYSKGAGLVRLKTKPDRLKMPAGTTANDIKKAKATSVYYDFKAKAFRSCYGVTTRFTEELYAALYEPAPPTAEEVVQCLALDASVLDHAGFADWASDYGYDTDSRRAKKIYDSCMEQSLQLKAALGDDRLRELQAIEY